MSDGEWERKLIVSFVENMQNYMWPNAESTSKHKIDYTTATHGKDRSIRAAFDQSQPAISWEEFLEVVQQINTGLPTTEYGICAYIRSLMMQLFDQNAPKGKLRIYSDAINIGSVLTDIIVEGETVHGYTVKYEIPIKTGATLLKFIEVGPKDKLTTIKTFGITDRGEMIKIMVAFNGRVICDYVEGKLSDFMKNKVSSSYLKDMNLYEI